MNTLKIQQSINLTAQIKLKTMINIMFTNILWIVLRRLMFDKYCKNNLKTIKAKI